MALPFPNIDPVAVAFGPLQVRWYGLAYLAGFLGGWLYAGWLADLDRDRRPNREDIDNLLPLLVLGVIAGGRIGYILFYNLDAYLENPLDMLKVWQGGMSFHGGLLGVATAIIGYAWKNKIPPLAIGDIIATVVPIGLFFGRIANFINGELYGRITNVPWAMVFPRGHDMPRHPSQIYEACLEGICLFTVMYFLARNANIRRTRGFLFGTFLVGYGLCRCVIEYFREPDEQIGFIFQYFSMGQLLSLPMIAAGLAIIWYGKNKTTSAR